MAHDKKPPIGEQATTTTSGEVYGPQQPAAVEPAPVATIAIPLRWVRVTHHSPDHIAARYPYAAYGSNLNLAQIGKRCPQVNIVGPGILRSARLVFAYHLGIIEDPAATVPVGVYRLTASDIAILDRYEGLGRSYERFLVTVEMDGQAVRCFTYVKRHNEVEPPSDRYYATCLQGFTDWQFDARRLRHARDHARKNYKPRAWSRTQATETRYQPRYDSQGMRRPNQFDFDDWYRATFPTRGKGADSTADRDIPEDPAGDPAPRISLVTGRELPPKRHDKRTRFEDMTPSEIRANVAAHHMRKAPDSPLGVKTPAGQTEFTGRGGQRWLKGADGIWYPAPKSGA